MIRPKMSMRGLSSQQGAGNDAEVQRLRKEAEEKDKQLKDQTSALAEMEAQLAELSSLLATNSAEKQSSDALEPGTEDKDVNELRSMLRAKQDKIDQMTKEFDFHRADFRSTIDALETAATHTQEIYEKREKELVKEIEELQNGKEDVEQFQEQYKQFEEAVAELEEAVENARRGEAEAKSESEFLHGEVERVRLELKREREKAAKAVMGANAAVGESGTSSPSSSRDLESRDDEIRGLKAIIHSLSSGVDTSSPAPKRGSIDAEAERTLKAQVSALTREKSELQGLVERKTHEEVELRRENARLLSANGMSNDYNSYGGKVNGISHRHTDSTSTATMHTANRNSATSTGTAFRPSTRGSFNTPPQTNSRPSSGTMQRPKSGTADRPTSRSWAEERAVSEDEASTTEGSEAATDIFCELCKVEGHDILICPLMNPERGLDGPASAGGRAENNQEDDMEEDTTVETPRPKSNGASFMTRMRSSKEDVKISSPNAPPMPKEESAQPAQPEAASLPSLDSTGPAPGKSTGKIEDGKWCAMCERDGHDSFDCPFEEEY